MGGGASSRPAGPPPGTYSGPADRGRAGPATPGPATPGGAAPRPPGAPGDGPRTPDGLPDGPSPLPFPITPYEEVADLAAWQIWWEHNKHPYLGLASIETAIETGSDDFFLGEGERRIALRGQRASDGQLRGKVLPALYEALSVGGNERLSENGILAVAKASRASRFAYARSMFRNFLSLPHTGVNQAAALALGIPGEEAAYPDLSGVALDTEAGREILGCDEIDERIRAYAVYGLGVLGEANANREMRRAIVRDLAALLEDPDSSTDLAVAATVALGLVPIEVVEGAPTCYCADCDIGPPEASFQEEVAYLLRVLRDDRGRPRLVRAHAATALGRLIEAGAREGVPVELENGVARALVEVLEEGSRAPDVVRESAVLALGLLGDADDDPVDAWVRGELARAASSGSTFERRFALVSLALVGSRPGTGEAPFAAAAQVRDQLVRHLARGRRGTRSWTAVALGVFGHWLRAYGEPLDGAVDAALRSSLRSARDAGDVAALSLAVGLRRDGAAVEILVAKLAELADESARAYAALGLGLVGDRAAIDALRAALGAGDERPLLTTNAGLALGLIGDSRVTPVLLESLARAQSEVQEVAIVRALGLVGSSEALDALAALVLDEDAGDKVRSACASALGQVADRAPLPWHSRISTAMNYNALTASLSSTDREGVLDFD